MKKLGILLLVFTMILGLLPKTAMAAETTYSAQDLTSYLQQVSTERGFSVSETDLDAILATYDMTQADFTSIDDLKSFLGDVIQADLSNLNSVYDYYNLDQDTLTQKLNEYGEELSDYVFVDDLDTALSFYTEDVSSSDAFSGIDTQMVLDMLGQMDITEDELLNIKNYYSSMSDYYNSADVQTKLQDLGIRMMDLGNTIIAEGTADENYKLTDAEVTEVASLYNELFSLLKVNAEFSLVSNGVATPITLEDLLRLDDLKDADLQVKLYDSNSQLLADATVTGDLLTSEFGDFVQEANNSTSMDTDNGSVQTVKGATLPKTATNYIPNAVLGLILVLAGTIVYRKVRNNKGEILE